MHALQTDFYELTMAAGYFAAQRQHDVATFELSVRRLPEQRNFLIAAGLAQAVEYLQNLRFQTDEIDYLRALPQFRLAPAGFFDYLRDFRFTGDLFAIPEGTPFFPNEPVATIRAPLIEAQLVETYLLSTFAFQSSIATKAARCTLAAEGRAIVEFGSRRAHGPEAGVLAARAAYIGGCIGTSNTEAGKLFGVPLFGTAAHSWTMAFGDEREAFQCLQKLLGENTVFLLDTYDTHNAARLATELGGPIWGVRLDSGDLVQLSREVRSILDAGGLSSAKIFASNDLDEYRLAEIVGAKAPIDAFGVGTALATSFDAPSLSAVYKLVELKREDRVLYTAKFSGEKSTLPGAKQIYRFEDRDLLALQTECSSDFGSSPLVRPVLIAGQLVEALPPIEQSRARALEKVAQLPKNLLALDRRAEHPVDISAKLRDLTENLRAQHQL
ncbi:MAG TPA: nicotinate phosphoribosyltransferase [Bryobacteraceae bacterium]|jgi:nicotinate phosphoribosyltransferase|nr:nicotinate phosphoribosyltransferase [Bryobacteraceae bacterium]